VLYLLHGAGDNDAHWAAIGRANVIADNLLADGKMTPMVIAMTDGHAYRPQQGEQGGREKALKMFEDDLLGDVVPLVEKGYRVETSRDRRAIAGLSMGGAQTLNVGLGHADRFAWIGAFSAAVIGVDAKVTALAANAAAFNKGSRLLWLRIGKDVFLLQQNRTLVESLKKAGIVHEYEEVEGAHMWGVWRKALADFLPRLFKPAGAAPPTAPPSAQAQR
jgi:enterochelin esterase-like enzyme